jgi:hypothetical protein
MKTEVLEQAFAFRAKYGYQPPYWRLFAMAQAATADAS